MTKTRVGRRWGWVGGGAALALTLCVWTSIAPTGAASSYANPAFQTQWQQGEAITPNFWGPLTTAKDGQPEPYKDVTGGTRLVQYFDKGRMELGTSNAVTNGLLASEIIKGQIQVGDAAFQQKAPAAISIAGDADNPGPTYAGLAAKGSSLLAATASKTGTPVAATVSAAGEVGTVDAAATSGAAFALAAYDSATKHNVPQAFVDYRTKAGLATIGLAISEPFLATVKVAGMQRQVMIQVFERRVLTYTASNPVAFQVEMGNIGQHYYQWRYTPTVQTVSTPATSAGTPTATGIPIPTGFVFIGNPGSPPTATRPGIAGPPVPVDPTYTPSAGMATPIRPGAGIAGSTDATQVSTQTAPTRGMSTSG